MDLTIGCRHPSPYFTSYNITVPRDRFVKEFKHHEYSMYVENHVIDYVPLISTALECLTLKYYLCRTILESNSELVIKYDMVKLLDDIDYKGLTNDDDDDIKHHFILYGKAIPYIPIEPPLECINGYITLHLVDHNYSVTYKGSPLYNLCVNGCIAWMICLAPGVLKIELKESYIKPAVLDALKYLTMNIQSNSYYTEMSRYFLIDELADPIVQSYVDHMEMSMISYDDPVCITLPIYDYKINLSKSCLQRKFIDCMLSKVLELDSETRAIPITNPNVKPEVINAIKILLDTNLEYDTDFIDSAYYLSVDQLTNPYLSALVKI